jgi:hypothetical protein
MTKYKELHRAVQHLTDYQMNGRVVRRAAEYRAANPDRKNPAQRISNGQISNGRMPNNQMPGFAPLHVRPMLSTPWMLPPGPSPSPVMTEAARLPSSGP